MRRDLRRLAAGRGLLARGCQSNIAVDGNGKDDNDSNNDGKESTTETGAVCSAAPPYIAIVGCGFSRTKTIAVMLTNHLNIATSYESLDPKALATSAVAGWPATVARYAAEPTGGSAGGGDGDGDPNQRQAYTLAVVRHPLAVLRAVRAFIKKSHLSPSHWDFTAEDAFAPPLSRVLKVRDWLPEPLAAGWDRLSGDVRTLAWWCAFTILADLVHSPPGTSALLRVEDLFDRGDVSALKGLVEARFGVDHLARFDWSQISDAARKYDSEHDVTLDEETAVSWFQLREAALEANFGDEATRVLELQVIDAAIELSIRSGYAFSP